MAVRGRTCSGSQNQRPGMGLGRFPGAAAWLSDSGQLERYFDDQGLVDAASAARPDSPVHA